MVSHEEMYQRVLRNRDEYIEREKRRKKIMIRSAIVFSGLCAALLFGLKLHSNSALNTPHDSLMIEETQFTDTTKESDTANTEKTVTQITDKHVHENITTSELHDEREKITSEDAKTTSVNAEFDKNKDVHSSETAKTKDESQTTEKAIEKNDKPVTEQTEPKETIPEPVITDEDPDIKEENEMKLQYKKAIAFLTALAAANPGGIISSAADIKTEYTSDEAILIEMDENHDRLDFNSDGIFDEFDTYDLYLYLNGKEYLPEKNIKNIEENADFNKDGKINELDFNLLDGYGQYNCCNYNNVSRYDLMDYLYGTEEIKNDFLSCPTINLYSDNYIYSMKYAAPSYKKLCKVFDSGIINPDVNMDGNTDLADLYDIYIYDAYADDFELAENDDELYFGSKCFTKEYKDRITVNCKPLFGDDLDFIGDAYKKIDLFARYYVTHSDITDQYLHEEFYDNIFDTRYEYETPWLTLSQLFVINLSEWVKAADIEDYDQLKIVMVDDIEYYLYDDHAVLRKNNSDLETIVIPTEINGTPVTKIESGAFNTNHKTKTVYIPEGFNVIDNSSFRGSTSIENVIISEGVSEIGTYAFEDCTNLKNISLPSSLKVIGAGAFSHCTALSEIKIPDGIECINESVFSCCTSLISIELPDSIKSIGDYAFEGCDILETIDFPDNLEEIGRNAFVGCGFKTLNFPENLKIINDYSFVDNLNLEKVVFPEGIEEIGWYSFLNCTKLLSVTIPKNLKQYAYFGFGEYIVNESDFMINTDFTLKYYLESKEDVEINFRQKGYNLVLIDEEESSNDEVKENFKPKAAEIMCGDIDGSGITDLTDLSLLSVALLSKNNLNEMQFKAADVDLNGEVDIADLAYLKQYVSKDSKVTAMFNKSR